MVLLASRMAGPDARQTLAARQDLCPRVRPSCKKHGTSRFFGKPAI